MLTEAGEGGRGLLEGKLEKQIERQLEKCNKELLLFKRQCENCEIVEDISSFVIALTKLSGTIDNYLDERDDSPVREELLDFYFEICHFLEMYEGLDDNYVIYTEMLEDGSFQMKLFCVNPSEKLKECMIRADSTILFSATLQKDMGRKKRHIISVPVLYGFI